MMSLFVPLLADADWIKLIVFLVFFLGPLVAKLFQGAQPGQPGQKKPAARPGPIAKGEGGAPPGGAPGRGAAPGGVLEREIEDFLRQARRNLPPEQQREQPNLARPITRNEVLEAEMVPASRVEGGISGASVSRHVREHIASRPVTAPSQHLGEEVGTSDERLEARLHETFDHRVGGLSSTDLRGSRIEEGTDSQVWEGGAATNTRHNDSLRKTATEVRRMIRNPDNVRQAIMWAEILKRPDERNWDL